MKLRKLILNGFKSFADRTEFDFDDGKLALEDVEKAITGLGYEVLKSRAK